MPVQLIHKEAPPWSSGLESLTSSPLTFLSDSLTNKKCLKIIENLTKSAFCRLA